MRFPIWMSLPRKLPGLFLLATLVPVIALVWLGWRLLDQDRALDNQRVMERLEDAADLIAAALLTLIFWAIAALVRRHYGRTLDLPVLPRFLRLGTRIVCAFVLASYAAWFVPFMSLSRDITRSAAMDP